MSWGSKISEMGWMGAIAAERPKVIPKAETRHAWKHLDEHQLRGLRNLLFAARRVVEGTYAGRHRSPFKGASPEFVDYREYHPGDSLRWLDWKAVARTDRLYVRLFEKQTDMNTMLLVDTSASMAYGGRQGENPLDHRKLSKMDYGLCLASSLAYLMIKQGDRVGMTLFDDGIRHHFPPGGTFGHLYKMLNVLERQWAINGTEPGRALRELFPLCRRRGLVIMISDLIVDEAELFSALNLFRHRGFEVILFHLLHEHELTLPPEASVNFVDAETMEWLNAKPDEIRETYREQVRAWIERLRAGARARQIEYCQIDTATPYETALRRYLIRRSRR